MSTDSSARSSSGYAAIGKYDVLAHVATGGMGAVYKARDRDTGAVVALKILPPELAAHPIRFERFQREARHSARLRHENIITLYDFGEANGTHYLALEFVEGIDLAEHIHLQGHLD